MMPQGWANPAPDIVESELSRQGGSAVPTRPFQVIRVSDFGGLNDDLATEIGDTQASVLTNWYKRPRKLVRRKGQLFVAEAASTLVGPCGSPYVPGQAVVLTDATTYLSRPNTADLNGAVALSVWVYFKDSLPAGNAFLMGKYSSVSPATLGEYGLYFAPAGPFFVFVRVDTVGNVVSVTNAGTFIPTANTWVHIWVHMISSTMQIFVNNAHGSSNGYAGTMASGRQPFRVGLTGNGAFPLGGAYIAQAAVLALPANPTTTRADIYNAGSGRRLSQMTAQTQGEVVSHWECDETADATTVCDWKGANHLAKNGSIGTAPGII